MNGYEEIVYDSNVPIKHLFFNAKENTKNLIIIFSSGKLYEYVNVLEDFDAHRLFIMDEYGPEGCYYLGPDMNFEVESSVLSLVTNYVRKYKIDFENIITVGAGAGGTAALYFGSKYNLGKIIAGSPEIKIGSFVNRNSKVSAEYLMGYPVSKLAVNKLNSLISKQFNKEVNSEVFIFTSENDPVYKTDLQEFIELLDSKKIRYELTINNEIKNHKEVNSYFESYLVKVLAKELLNIVINDISINKASDSWNFEMNANELENTELNWSIQFRYDTKILSEFKVNGKLMIPVKEISNLLEEPRLVNVVLIAAKGTSTVLALPIDNILAGNGTFVNNADLVLKNSQLIVRLDIENIENLNFAFYLRKNNRIIEKVDYQANPSWTFEIKDTGDYQVHYFVLSNNDEKYSNQTSTVAIQK